MYKTICVKSQSASVFRDGIDSIVKFYTPIQQMFKIYPRDISRMCDISGTFLGCILDIYTIWLISPTTINDAANILRIHIYSDILYDGYISWDRQLRVSMLLTN